MQGKVFRYIFWAGYLVVLLTAFVPVAGGLNRKFIGLDKLQIRLDHLLHILIYFLICLYYFLGLQKGIKLFQTTSHLKFFLLVLFLAIITEVVQLGVPERAFNPADLVANVAGIFAGTIVIVCRRKK